MELIDDKKPTPNYLWSILSMRCPRCRRGEMFVQSNTYKNLSMKNIFNMHEVCPVCKQKYDMEPGFWYGTGYVSYALTVAICVATFIAWWVLVGISIKDNSIFYWLIANGIILLVLQPWLMRLSRVIYLYFFVSYDADYDVNPPTAFDG